MSDEREKKNRSTIILIPVPFWERIYIINL